MPSGLYFQGPDRWTNDPAAAFDFKQISRAIKFAEKAGLDQMEVAFAYDNPGITAVPLGHLASGLSGARLDPVLAALVASTCVRRKA